MEVVAFIQSRYLCKICCNLYFRDVIESILQKLIKMQEIHFLLNTFVKIYTWNSNSYSFRSIHIMKNIDLKILGWNHFARMFVRWSIIQCNDSIISNNFNKRMLVTFIWFQKKIIRLPSFWYKRQFVSCADFYA